MSTEYSQQPTSPDRVTGKTICHRSWLQIPADARRDCGRVNLPLPQPFIAIRNE